MELKEIIILGLLICLVITFYFGMFFQCLRMGGLLESNFVCRGPGGDRLAATPFVPPGSLPALENWSFVLGDEHDG